jgi:hypothetical protein
MGAPLRVITVQAGNRYPDLYVTRLRRMVARHLPVDHTFVVYTDRVEPGRFQIGDAEETRLPPMELRELGSWGLPGYFNKLRLFDPSVTGEDPFLFFDITLVIRQSLSPLLAHEQEEAASVVGVADWNYPILNSSVLRVRPDAHTARVWRAWEAGERFGAPVAGDQNYIHQVFQAYAPEALRYWPSGFVASYKGLRKEAARDPRGAEARLQDALILKFHGHPKPHEVLAPWRHPASTLLRHPTRPRLWRYLAREIETHWR